MKKTVLALLDLYQFVARAILPPACRFSPSCSEFAKLAIEEHGCRGLLMTCRRLLSCHPFHPGGWDPVPGANNNG